MIELGLLVWVLALFFSSITCLFVGFDSFLMFLVGGVILLTLISGVFFVRPIRKMTFRQVMSEFLKVVVGGAVLGVIILASMFAMLGVTISFVMERMSRKIEREVMR